MMMDLPEPVTPANSRLPSTGMVSLYPYQLSAWMRVRRIVRFILCLYLQCLPPRVLQWASV